MNTKPPLSLPKPLSGALLTCSIAQHRAQVMLTGLWEGSCWAELDQHKGKPNSLCGCSLVMLALWVPSPPGVIAGIYCKAPEGEQDNISRPSGGEGSCVCMILCMDDAVYG